MGVGGDSRKGGGGGRDVPTLAYRPVPASRLTIGIASSMPAGAS